MLGAENCHRFFIWLLGARNSRAVCQKGRERKKTNLCAQRCFPLFLAQLELRWELWNCYIELPSGELHQP